MQALHYVLWCKRSTYTRATRNDCCRLIYFQEWPAIFLVHTTHVICVSWNKAKKVKQSICIAPCMVYKPLQIAQAWITVLPAINTIPAFYLVSVHRMAPPPIELANILLQLTTHLSTPKGWKVELASWLIFSGRFTDIGSPVSERSSAGQGRFADQRPAFRQVCWYVALSFDWP